MPTLSVLIVMKSLQRNPDRQHSWKYSGQELTDWLTGWLTQWEKKKKIESYQCLKLLRLWKAGTLYKHWVKEHTASKYCKIPKYSDTRKNCCIYHKNWTMCLYHSVMSPKDADGIANSVDPDQIAPLGAVWSWSTLFAQACLSKNLGSLR